VVTTIQASGVFKQVLDRAVVHDAMRDNPMIKVTLPRRSPPVPRAMTALEVYQVRRAVRDWEDYRRGRPGPRPTGSLPAAVDVMLGTGLRIGEVLALRWGDVDLDATRPTITVTATLVLIVGQGTVRQEYPKTKAGERTIVIPPFTVEALGSIRPPRTVPELPVFASRPFKARTDLPNPQTTANVRTSLRKALDRAGMSGAIHPHPLRATVVARKMSIADAAALLGHKIDAGVTVRHYIERLTLAPDISAVLQALIEIGEAEARSADGENAERAPQRADDGALEGDGSGWTPLTFDWGR
jgi:integrase